MNISVVNQIKNEDKKYMIIFTDTVKHLTKFNIHS